MRTNIALEPVPFPRTNRDCPGFNWIVFSWPLFHFFGVEWCKWFRPTEFTAFFATELWGWTAMWASSSSTNVVQALSNFVSTNAVENIFCLACLINLARGYWVFRTPLEHHIGVMKGKRLLVTVLTAVLVTWMTACTKRAPSVVEYNVIESTLKHSPACSAVEPHLLVACYSKISRA